MTGRLHIADPLPHINRSICAGIFILREDPALVDRVVAAKCRAMGEIRNPRSGAWERVRGDA